MPLFNAMRDACKELLLQRVCVQCTRCKTVAAWCSSTWASLLFESERECFRRQAAWQQARITPWCCSIIMSRPHVAAASATTTNAAAAGRACRCGGRVCILRGSSATCSRSTGPGCGGRGRACLKTLPKTTHGGVRVNWAILICLYCSSLKATVPLAIARATRRRCVARHGGHVDGIAGRQAGQAARAATSRWCCCYRRQCLGCKVWARGGRQRGG